MLLYVSCLEDLDKKVRSNSNYISHCLYRGYDILSKVFIYDKDSNEYKNVDWINFWNKYPKLFFIIFDVSYDLLHIVRDLDICEIPNLCKHFLFKKKYFQNPKLQKYCANEMKFCDSHDFTFPFPKEFQDYNRAEDYCLVAQNIIRTCSHPSDNVLLFLKTIIERISIAIVDYEKNLQNVRRMEQRYVKVDMMMEAISHCCEKYVYEIAKPISDEATSLSWDTFISIESLYMTYEIPIQILYETIGAYAEWKNRK